MKINYVSLNKQSKDQSQKLLKIFRDCLNKSIFVNGDEVSKFERKVSRKCGTKYAVALNSGTDALTLALKLVGIKKGDEVITPPNSFISSTSSIIHLGAKPVFVDTAEDQNIDPNKIEKKITNKTKAIMPVHLTGRVCEMNEIIKISKKYKIPIIEDAAQSIGSKYYGKLAGSIGDIGCFSTHPLKNLNACGDGGFLTTNNKQYYILAKSLQNNGMLGRNEVKHFGYLSRMDVLQASILDYRLDKLDEVIKKRRSNFVLYKKLLDRSKIFFPDEKDYQFNTYHTFVIQVEKRDKLINFLKKKNIQTAIHYPIPIHKQAAYINKFGKEKYLNTEIQSKKILTLPINQYLTKKQIIYISENVNSFYK